MGESAPFNRGGGEARFQGITEDAGEEGAPPPERERGAGTAAEGEL